MKKLAFTLMLAFTFIGMANAQSLQLHKEKVGKTYVYTYQTEDGEDYCSVYTDNGTPDKFVSGLQRIVKDGKIGFIDKKGVIVIVPQYDLAEQFAGNNCLVNKGAQVEGADDNAQGGLWGVIDKKGKVVMPCGYHKVWDEERNTNIYHNGTKGFEFTKKGKLISTTKKK